MKLKILLMRTEHCDECAMQRFQICVKSRMYLRACGRIVRSLQGVPKGLPAFKGSVHLLPSVQIARPFTSSTFSAKGKSFKDVILRKGEDWINGKKLKETFPWVQLETAGGSSLHHFIVSQGHFKSGNNTEAVKSLKLSVDEGFTEAMFSLGMCYWYGTGVDKNLDEAARYIQMAADKGHGHAHFVFGKSAGGTEQAKRHYLTAVEQQCYEAHYSLAVCYLSSGNVTDIEAGLAQLELAAKFPQSRDYATARYRIGLIHNYSLHGVKEDPRAAFVHFSAAAERGHREAQHELGACYMRGRGVAKDVLKGAEYFKRSADQHYSEAQVMLGRCYLHGSGVPKDPTQYLYYTKLAADQHNPEALCDLGVMYHTGTEVSIDTFKAFGLFQQAAELKSPRGMSSVAECYRNGFGVGVNLTSAVDYHTRAAQLHYPPSLWMLGRMYETGTGVAKDPAKAVGFYQRAAALGDKDAMKELSRCYATGSGVPINLTVAEEFRVRSIDK